MKVLEIGTSVFVNRGHDTVQCGKISAHVVSTREKEGEEEHEVTVQYEVKFPYPAPSRFDDPDDSPPFNRQTFFHSDQVYLTLEDAFYKKKAQ